MMSGMRRLTAALGAVALVALVGGLMAAPAHAEDPPENPTRITVDQDKVLPGTKVFISGTGEPNTRVDFYAGPVDDGNSMKPVGYKTTNADGTFSLGTTIRQTTVIQATILESWSTVRIESYTTIKVRAHILGRGKVQWEVNGGPSTYGYVNVLKRTALGINTRIAHVRSNKYGDAVLTTSSAPQPGGIFFTVGFQVPGSTVATRSVVLQVT